MPVYAHGSRATVVGTNARAILSLYGTTGVIAKIREIGVFNTTTTAVAIAVARMTNATNVGAGLAENLVSASAGPAATATIFAGHTGDGGVGGIIRQASLGAAIGSGVIFTFGGNGLVINNATADGVGIIIPTGTGQICDVYIEWEE